MSWPAARRSAGDLGDAGFAYHGDADLAGVGELFFDLLRHVPGQYGGADVVDVVRPYHHPDLAAGLHREDLFDAVLAGGDLLDPLQPLDVRLQAFPARARPTTGTGVRSLRQHGFDCLRRHLVVVGLDGVDHRVVLAELAGQEGAPLDQLRLQAQL